MAKIEGFALRASILHECQNYLGGGGGLKGSEKNRGTVITSLQLAFRRRFFSRPPPHTAIIPDACPLGTFENQDGRH